MLAFIAYVIAAVIFIVNALGSEFTDNPVMWGLFFVALGLALSQVPYGPQWPNRP